MAGPSPIEAVAPVAASGWAVAAARRTGESHRRRDERGQDALALRLRGGVLIAAVADGAGSAARGGAGAALAVRSVVQAACSAPLPATDATIEGWIAKARAHLAATAGIQGLTPRDLATTLILAITDGRQTMVAHIGDGAAVVRAADGWQALSWPAGGEHAGSTYFLTDEAPALRITRHSEAITALALLTDGLERLVLDFASMAAHGPFFDRMTAPLDALTKPGRDAALCRALGAWLGGAGVAARTDDDRTLLLARAMP